MSLIEMEQKILALQQPIVQTRDVSACLNISITHASHILNRLVQAKRFVHLIRGRWATSHKMDALIVPAALTTPFPTYISLQTALFYHGLISQIPHTVYAVSLARTRQYTTYFGSVSIHHVQPNFFFGFESMGLFYMATPEKALIDVLYLTSVKSAWFKSLPEIEFPEHFSCENAHAAIAQITSPRIKTIVQERFKNLYSAAFEA